MAEDREEQARSRVGMVLNEKWTLERLIGIGGMACVYAAKHRNGAKAAVKVLHPDIGRIEEVLRRFLREGKAANLVDHPGAVKVLDDDVISSGPDKGAAFLVMELLEGESLEDRIESGPPISEREMLVILQQILDVLAVAHASGVIHRDLKPENLFLAKSKDEPDVAPRVKILDFGLARLADGGIGTVHGLAIGTPSYMPPEQAGGKADEIELRTDLFAVGATSFRILAGRTVHPGKNAVDIVLKMARDAAPKLRSVAPSISEATARVIDRALEFKKQDRWPDAKTMRAAVDEALLALDDHGILELPQDLLKTFHAEPAPVPAPVAERASVTAPVSAPAAFTPSPARAAGLEPVRSEDSILVSLGLKPSMLRRRWRLLLVLALLYGGIALKLSSEDSEIEPATDAGAAIDGSTIDALVDASGDASVADALVRTKVDASVAKVVASSVDASIVGASSVDAGHIKPTPSSHPSTKPSSAVKPPHHK